MIFFDDEFDYEEAFYIGCMGGFIDQWEEEERRIRRIIEEDDTEDIDDLEEYY